MQYPEVRVVRRAGEIEQVVWKRREAETELDRLMALAPPGLDLVPLEIVEISATVRDGADPTVTITIPARLVDVDVEGVS